MEDNDYLVVHLLLSIHSLEAGTACSEHNLAIIQFIYSNIVFITFDNA